MLPDLVFVKKNRLSSFHSFILATNSHKMDTNLVLLLAPKAFGVNVHSRLVLKCLKTYKLAA